MSPEKKEKPPSTLEEQMICATDVKACPDGSYVSRDPAKTCEFRACAGQPEKKTDMPQGKTQKP